MREKGLRILLVGFGADDLPFEHVQDPVEQFKIYLSNGDRHSSIPMVEMPPGVESVSWNDYSGLTLYDYDVILMDLSKVNETTQTWEYARKKQEQLDKFLGTEQGGLLICLCAALEYPKSLKSIIPLDSELWMVPEHSDRCQKVLPGILSHPFNPYKGQDFYFGGVFPPDTEVIASNRIGKALSFQYRRGKGRVILWPEVKQKSELIKFVLDRLVPDLVGVPEPQWLDEVMFHDEQVLRGKAVEIQRNVEDYQRWKVLLYGTGPRLCQTVKDALNFLEVKTNDPREGYDHDLEVKLPEDVVGVVEVTGTTGPIDVDKIRQLLDFHTTFEEKEPQKKAKGILIANPQRENPPDKRDCSFTPKAVDLACRNGFSLYTTIQLYRLLEASFKGQKVREALIRILSETKGPS